MEAQNSRIMTMALSILAVLALIGSLNVASSILIPFVLSIILAFVLMPVVIQLKNRKVPGALAAVASLGLAMAFLSVVSYLVYLSLNSMNQAIPTYSLKFKEFFHSADEFLAGYNVDINSYWPEVQKQATVMVGKTANILLGLSKNGLLIFFITLFMLIEGTRYQTKAVKAFGKGNFFATSAAKIAQDIQRYLMFKTLISLATGTLVWIVLTIIGLDFPLVWGLLAFVLNFIPSIGSIVASLPPILLALVQFDSPVQYALIVAVCLLTIQGIIGNYLDPKIMGDNLNLSPLIIFLSMVFWGWLWGPVGMLLAVPLAVSLKVALHHHERSRPIALMMEG